MPTTKFERLGYKKVGGYQKVGAQQKLGKRGRQRRAQTRWRKVGIFSRLIGSVNGARVHPGLEYKQKYENPTKKMTWAAGYIQKIWRGKCAREELYWEMMYGDIY